LSRFVLFEDDGTGYSGFGPQVRALQVLTGQVLTGQMLTGQVLTGQMLTGMCRD
jgi:hypothetical protein